MIFLETIFATNDVMIAVVGREADVCVCLCKREVDRGVV